jgi:hypothetical protein
MMSRIVFAMIRSPFAIVLTVCVGEAAVTAELARIIHETRTVFAGRPGGAASKAPFWGLASQGSRRRSPTLLGSNGRRGALRPESRHDVWPAEAGPGGETNSERHGGREHRGAARGDRTRPTGAANYRVANHAG